MDQSVITFCSSFANRVSRRSLLGRSSTLALGLVGGSALYGLMAADARGDDPIEGPCSKQTCACWRVCCKACAMGHHEEPIGETLDLARGKYMQFYSYIKYGTCPRGDCHAYAQCTNVQCTQAAKCV